MEDVERRYIDVIGGLLDTLYPGFTVCPVWQTKYVFHTWTVTFVSHRRY